MLSINITPLIGCLIDAKEMSKILLTNFLTELKKQIGTWYEIKCGEIYSQLMTPSTFIFRKNKSEVLQAYRCLLSDKSFRRVWSKHDFSCGYILSVGG